MLSRLSASLSASSAQSTDPLLDTSLGSRQNRRQPNKAKSVWYAPRKGGQGINKRDRSRSCIGLSAEIADWGLARRPRHRGLLAPIRGGGGRRVGALASCMMCLASTARWRWRRAWLESNQWRGRAAADRVRASPGRMTTPAEDPDGTVPACPLPWDLGSQPRATQWRP